MAKKPLVRLTFPDAKSAVTIFHGIFNRQMQAILDEVYDPDPNTRTQFEKLRARRRLAKLCARFNLVISNTEETDLFPQPKHAPAIAKGRTAKVSTLDGGISIKDIADCYATYYNCNPQSQQEEQACQDVLFDCISRC